MLLRVIAADVADAAGDHDGLVITAAIARHFHFERAEVAAEVRTTELVVERRGADRAIEHDGERGCDADRLADRSFPWLRERRNPQMRHSEPDQSRLRFGAGAGRAFIANLAARPRCSAGKRRDCRRMVVRLDLQYDVGRFARGAIAKVASWIETIDARAFDDRRVVGIRDDGALWMRCMRRANHREQGPLLRNT